MITRIVKLEFQPDRIDNFLIFFDEIKHKVNHFPGCLGMQLLKDIHNPTIIMTYSHWESAGDLEKYRLSETFGEIWPLIKPWFNEKPQAWTLNTHFNGFEEKTE
jgi:autoinducer 2-degrading protein